MQAPGVDRVAEWMRRRFIQLRSADSLLEAERLMRMARVRVLPVVEDHLLAGILSHRHLLQSSLVADGAGSARSSASWMREVPVAALMDRGPLVVTPETALWVAVERLIECEGGCIPVVADGPQPAPLVAILTERDLLRAAYASDRRH